MWALVIFLFVQQGLDVILVNTRTDKEYQVESQCWSRATVETKVLPLQPGNDARWQYATEAMSNDRELLELAAKAAGIKYSDGLPEWGSEETWESLWNPLTDDGDAAELGKAMRSEEEGAGDDNG